MENIKNILMTSHLSNVSVVDKPVEKVKKVDISKVITKPKTLRINLNSGCIEGNLIELPFASYSIDKKNKELVTVIEYQWVDSGGIERGVEVRGSGKYGVPTYFEFDVLIALLRIYIKSSKIILNRENFSSKDITDDDITINFTITQVCKEMGYKNVGGKLFDKIGIAIEILTDTTIYNRHGGGIYDIESKSYICDKTIAFHIIEQFESTRYKDSSSDKRIRGQEIVQKVRLNKFFYKSIAGNYFKFYDHAQYIAISTSIGKKLFLIFNKWRNNKDYLKLKCETLYQRIPLDSRLPMHRKNQMLKRALDSLVDVTFVKSYELKNGYITINFTDNNAMIESDDNMYFKNRYNEYNEIIDRLINIGVSQDIVSSHLNTIVFDNGYIKALLRYADMQTYYKRVDDEKGFIVAGMLKKYTIDEKYYN